MPPGDDAEASRRAALFRENRFEMGSSSTFAENVVTG